MHVPAFALQEYIRSLGGSFSVTVHAFDGVPGQKIKVEEGKITHELLECCRPRRLRLRLL